MPVYARLEPLSTTAEAIVSSTNLTYTNTGTPYRVAIKNVDGAITVYLGGADVANTGANGYELLFGTTISLDLYTGDVLYAVAASGTPNIRILELGNKKI
jgi:hypothetical protein